MIREQQKSTALVDPTFRKPTAITQMVNRYSAPEHKLMNLCLALASEYSFKQPKCSLSISKVKYYLGSAKTKNHDWLKEVAEGLVTKKIEWNALRQDRTVEWGICTFLSSASIVGNKFQFRINPEIIERLHHPKVWGQFRLLAQIRMAKRYSLVMYGFLKDATCRLGAENVCEVEVPLEDLRKVLGLKPGEYQEYKFFNQFVLKPAVDPKKGEINLMSDLEVECRGIREGRKVKRLAFKIRQKDQFQLALDLPELGIPAPKAAVALEKKSKREVKELCDLLEEQGVEHEQAMKLITTYTEDRIRENVRHVLNEISNGKAIKNRAAYLVSAIERDFRPKLVAAEARGRDKEGRRDGTAERHRKLQPDWQKYREDQAWAYFAVLPQEEQAEHRDAFVQHMTGTLLTQFRMQGWEHPVVNKAFCESYLTQRLLKTPEEIDIEAYAASRAG